MKKFNLSDWALDHSSLVWYFMIVFALLGFFTYQNLGREEDPSFTIKTMTISAAWPGASVEETTLQVTERIERKLEELESLDFTRSITTPGQTLIFVNLKPTTRARDVAPTWVTVRNMINDIRGDFPSGVVGPAFNDRFGDVFGNIYAFTSDGLTSASCATMSRTRVQGAHRRQCRQGRLVGAQDEVIYLEFSTRQLAALGISPSRSSRPAGIRTPSRPRASSRRGRNASACVSADSFTSEESLSATDQPQGQRPLLPPVDVATITRGYVDPPSALFRYNGEPAIGLAIGMKPALEPAGVRRGAGEGDRPRSLARPADRRRRASSFPTSPRSSRRPSMASPGAVRGRRHRAGGQLRQPRPPRRPGRGFLHSAGARHHLPRHGAYYDGISLQRISLGALIIALGLLVDDAMIAVEMMVARLEAGDTLRKAATYVYTSTAFPMLTGTLVTVAGFIPDRPQQQPGRRIHLHPVRRHRGGAARLLGGRGAVHAAARRHRCCRKMKKHASSAAGWFDGVRRLLEPACGCAGRPSSSPSLIFGWSRSSP
jgi:hypothetical protein